MEVLWFWWRVTIPIAVEKLYKHNNNRGRWFFHRSLLFYLHILAYFVMSYRLQWLYIAHAVLCLHFIEKRLLTLFLDDLKSGKFHNQCQECSNGRCLVDMYIIRYTALGVSCGVIYHIQREASALLVQHWWAIPEPQFVGRVAVMGSHAFFVQ